MLRASLMFFVLALGGLVFGFYGLANITMEIGFFILGFFVVLSMISFFAALANIRPPQPQNGWL